MTMAGLRVRDFDAESVLQIREECQDVDLEADCIIPMSRMFQENENSPREGQGDVIGNTSPLHGVLYRLGRGRVDTG
jgi:hypothetical protein